ncbi:MAG: outer membrane beta-barrel protein, partial [Chlorobi bacterium]|nr:outer membrane beta-barrel protein [Chlorobiota bacterium]
AQIQFGVGAGYTTLSSSTSYTEPIEDGGTGFSSGIHYGAKVRIFLPLLPINIVGHFFYSPLNSKGTYTYQGVTADYENSGSLMNFEAGGEFTLFPTGIKPYLYAVFLISKFGKTTQTVTVQGTTYENTITEAKNRTGLGIGAGVRFTLLPVIDLEVAARYNINNMFGREEGEEYLNTFNLTALVLF